MMIMNMLMEAVIPFVSNDVSRKINEIDIYDDDAISKLGYQISELAYNGVCQVIGVNFFKFYIN